MSEGNRCLGFGILVNATGAVPSDVTSYSNALDQSLGCNHLVCSACGAPVASFPGWAWSVEVRPELDVVLSADLATAAQDGASTVAAGALVADAKARLYRCKCTVHIENATSPIERYRETGTSSVGGKWQCGGHSPRVLPTVVDGVAVDPRTGNAREWVLAAIDVAADGTVESRQVAGRRLARLWFALAGTEVDAQVTMAVAALVNAREQYRRDQALVFYSLVPAAVGAERLGIWLSENPADFAASDDFPRRRVVAFRAIVKTVEAGRPFEPPVRELLRAAATEPELGRELFKVLAYHDRDWFIAHAHELPKALHAEIKALLPYTVPRAERAAVEGRLAAVD